MLKWTTWAMSVLRPKRRAADLCGNCYQNFLRSRRKFIPGRTAPPNHIIQILQITYGVSRHQEGRTGAWGWEQALGWGYQKAGCKEPDSKDLRWAGRNRVQGKKSKQRAPETPEKSFCETPSCFPTGDFGSEEGRPYCPTCPQAAHGLLAISKFCLSSVLKCMNCKKISWSGSVFTRSLMNCQWTWSVRWACCSAQAQFPCNKTVCDSMYF